MKHQVKSTSRAAHESIMPAKAYYHKKVIEGLEKLKVGGTFAEIADAVDVKHDKIWKRISEVAKLEIVFDTGITRKLPSGRQGTVWQLTSRKHSYANEVINSATNNPKQTELF